MSKYFRLAIVGLGGVGNFVASNLWGFIRADVSGWALKDILFIDHDTYSAGNRPRQLAAGAMLGRNKAVAWKDIFERSPENRQGTEFHVNTNWITADSVRDQLKPVLNGGIPLVVFACVDNHPARLVLSRFVKSYRGSSPLVVIQGGCEKNYATSDLYGKWPNGDGERIVVGCPIEDGHPEVLQDHEGDRDNMSCEELALSSKGDQTLATNFMAAFMMLNKLFTLLHPGGAETLAMYRGETMEVTTYWHSIEKELPPELMETSGSPEEGNNDNETKES